MATENDKTDAKPDADRRKDWDKQDAEVAAITRTVQPKGDAPSRSGITGPGSGADAEQG